MSLLKCTDYFRLLIKLGKMKGNTNYTLSQRYVLVGLRLLIGWHILYEGFSKLLIPNWSSANFLMESKWILEGFANWIISNPSVLKAVDFLNIWGLIAIGLGLMLGLFTRVAAVSGAVLLFMYYLINPPLIGLEDKDIDAVMIATPDHHHAPITIAAALAGKHVYCEKAPVHSEDEINPLYETVRNSNITYQLGHQITQSVIFQQAREIVSKDIIGKITLVETSTNRNTSDGAWIRHLDGNGNLKPGDEKTIDWQQFLGNAPKVPFSVERYYNWTKYFDYDTGLLGQLFSHEYDSVNQLLHIGIPKSVVSSGGIYYWKDNRDMADTLQCTFEYPDLDLTLLYSACLANSQPRGRSFMGHDATMILGDSIKITVDGDSTRYKKQIEAGLMDPSTPIVSFNPNAGSIDAVSSATEKYYASRGLTTTNINGVNVDVTYLHVREWIDCIRTGKTPTVNIERAFEEAVTLIMAHKSYVEKRRVEWDPVRRVIV